MGRSRTSISLGLLDVQRTSGVYFLLSHDETLVKIGKSRKPRKRIKELRHINSHPLAVLLVVPGYTTVESALHRLFYQHWSHGEWFHYVKPIADWVERYKACQSIDEMLPGARAQDERDDEWRRRMDEMDAAMTNTTPDK